MLFTLFCLFFFLVEFFPFKDECIIPFLHAIGFYIKLILKSGALCDNLFKLNVNKKQIGNRYSKFSSFQMISSWRMASTGQITLDQHLLNVSDAFRICEKPVCSWLSYKGYLNLSSIL